MRQVVYKYNSLGVYQTEDRCTFGRDEWLELVVEPHSFSLAIGGDILRKTSLAGYTVEVSCRGETIFYDEEHRVIGRADKTEHCYEAVLFRWTVGRLCVQFGYTDTVDYYPYCDGESDRWGEEWIVEREVIWDIDANRVVVEK